ncbi:hypothetical protein ACQY0O_004666 [Thecaphora frezii]
MVWRSPTEVPHPLSSQPHPDAYLAPTALLDSPLPRRPPLDVQSWNAWLKVYQAGQWTQLSDPPSPTNSGPTSTSLTPRTSVDANVGLPTPPVLDPETGQLTSSFDFFQRNGYLAPPHPPAARLENRNEALIRHRLLSPDVSNILNVYVQHAKDIFGAEYGAVTMAKLDAHSVNIFSSLGCGLEDLSSLSTTGSICSHALLLGDECMVLRDRSKDWRFCDLPFGPHPDAGIDAPDGFQFYASAPLMASAPAHRSQSGLRAEIKLPVGRLCVLGIKPRPDFGEKDLARLEAVAEMASKAVESAWQTIRFTRVLKMQQATSSLAALLEKQSLAFMSDAGDHSGGFDCNFVGAVTSTLHETLGATTTVCFDISTFYAALGAEESKARRRGSTFHRLGLLVNPENSTVVTAVQKQPQPFAPKVLSACGHHTDYVEDQLQKSSGPRAIFDWLRLRKEADWSQPSLYQRSEDGEKTEPTATSTSPLLSNLLPDDASTCVSHVVLNAEGTEPMFMFLVLFQDKTVVEDFDVDFVSSLGAILQGMTLRERAVESERAKVSFVRQMSHELRTPLHGITGMATQLASLLAENGPLSPHDRTESIWLTKAIVLAGKDLRKAIDDLIDVNALTASQPESETGDDRSSDVSGAPLDLVGLVETVALQEHQRSSISLADALHSDGTSKPPLLLVRQSPEAYRARPCVRLKDGNFVRKIVQQIVNNAFRFSKPTGAVLEVSVQKPKYNGAAATIEVVVRDNGIGMSTEFVRLHYRKPFSKASSFKQGTGLGVALVELLLHEIGGRLEVESAENQGTAVTITLPIDASRRDAVLTPDGVLGLTTGPALAPGSSTNAATAFFDPRFCSTECGPLTDFLKRYCEDALATCNIAAAAASEGASILLLPFDESTHLEQVKIHARTDGRQKLVLLDLSYGQQECMASEARTWALSVGIDCLCLRPPFHTEALQTLDAFLRSTSLASVLELPPKGVKPSLSATIVQLQLDPFPEIGKEPRIQQQPQPQSTPPPQPQQPHQPQPVSTDVPTLLVASPIALTTPRPALWEACNTPKPPAIAVLETQADAAAPLRHEVALGDVPQGKGAFSVLLVEDNPINMRLLRSVVKKLGCDYEEAEDGQQAVERFRAKTPSVVLLDISLPVMDGFEACKLMREHWASLWGGDSEAVDGTDEAAAGVGAAAAPSRRRPPRIVAVSALSTPTDIQRGIEECGMDEWRIKPTNLVKLRKDLFKWQQEWSDADGAVAAVAEATLGGQGAR